MNDETIKTEIKSGFNWDRIPVIVRAIIIGMFVNAIAVGLWPSLAFTLSTPFAFALMAVFLWIYLKYLSGSWKPMRTVAIRKENFRDIHLPKQVWVLGVMGAILLWVNKTVFTEFIFRLFPFPSDSYSTTLNYFNGLSTSNAILAIVMTSLVAGIAEETGLRGYMQKPLEKKYGPVLAIVITSLAFAAIHLPQVTNGPYLLVLFTFSMFFGVLAYASNSLLPGIIVHALMDTHAFMYLTGFFGEPSEYKETIFEIGIDAHFIAVTFIMIFSGVLFAIAMKKLMSFKK